jgi:hypothetical protein
MCRLSCGFQSKLIVTSSFINETICSIEFQLMCFVIVVIVVTHLCMCHLFVIAHRLAKHLMRRVAATVCRRGTCTSIMPPSCVMSLMLSSHCVLDSMMTTSMGAWLPSSSSSSSSLITMNDNMVRRGVKFRSDAIDTWLYPVNSNTTEATPLFMQQGKIADKAAQLFTSRHGRAPSKGNKKKDDHQASVKFIIGAVKVEDFPKTLINTNINNNGKGQNNGKSNNNRHEGLVTAAINNSGIAGASVQSVLELGGEVAFAGRSNVGKSSLLNALVNDKIARTSNTPGRTQQLNFFALPGAKLHIVDLPGYGNLSVYHVSETGN